MSKRVYVAGPMTGYDELNYPAFAAASARLRAQGFEVVSPAELNPITTGYREAMRNDILALLDCDHVFLLDGWEKSKVPTLENHIAEIMGITVIEQHSYCGKVHEVSDPKCNEDEVIYFDESPDVLEKGFNA